MEKLFSKPNDNPIPDYMHYGFLDHNIYPMNAKIWYDSDENGSYFCVNDDRWLTFDKDKKLTKIYLPGLSYIPRKTFNTDVGNPGTFEKFVAAYEAGAFAKTLEYVEELNLPDVIRIEENNFGRIGIKTLKIPKCEYIGVGSFRQVPSLMDIDATSLVWCDDNVFTEVCFDFEHPVTFDFPNLTVTGRWCFNNAFAIRGVNVPHVRVLGCGAFGCCRLLKEFNGPELREVHNYAFQDCTGMTKFSANKMHTVGNGVFKNANNLKELEAENLGRAGANCHPLVYDVLLQNKMK